MPAVEESVLPPEALDLGTSDVHVRGGDRDAFRRLDDPAQAAFIGFHAPVRNRRARRAIVPEQRQQVRRRAWTSARPRSVSAGSVFTGGAAIDSASRPSVDQPITSEDLTDQRTATSVREQKDRGGRDISGAPRIAAAQWTRDQ